MFGGFIKSKKENKEETKEEAPKETTSAITEPTTETTAEAEDRTPREKEKRRGSFFGNLAIKKKDSEAKDEETPATETAKREKSPIPGLGALGRKLSKAYKSSGEHKTTPATKAEPEVKATETPATTDTPAAAPTAESKIVGDVVPETLASTTPATNGPTEVKASA